MPTIRQGETRTYRLTIVDSDGSAPTGGTSNWTVLHVVKRDDGSAEELIRKSNQVPGEIDLTVNPPNTDDNQWDIIYLAADTAALPCGNYQRFTKVITNNGSIDHVHEDVLQVLPEGVS